jgi:peptidoglycan hydrolase-like protein with peptidoglycan-binding domain
VDEEEFEFEFFPEQPEPREEHEDTEWDSPLSERPRPRSRPRAASAPPDTVMRRRITAVAAVVGFILFIVLIVVLTSGSGGSGGTYQSYLTKISPIASDSQQAGTSLAADLSAAQSASGRSGVVAKLDTLIQQANGQIASLEALQTPSTLTSQQAQALAALDLRLRALQGLRDSVSQGLATQGDTSWDAVATAQVDDLKTSDLLWEGARTSANSVLQAHGGGFFPASSFVEDPASLLKSVHGVFGLGAVTTTTGRVLSLGSSGPDVVAWQNALNRWLKATAPTQTPLTADGTFGATTQTVTQQLQTAQGLTPDGIVGASTRRALAQALAGSSSSSTQTSPTAATLKLGDTGAAVVSWQNQLNQWLKLKFPTQTQLTADGSFGAATQTATEQLQSAAGLAPSGQVDTATRQALNNALAKTG